MAIIVDTRDAARRPGPDGQRGLVPRPAQQRYGTQVVAGVTPGKGGQDVEGDPGLRHGRRGRRGDAARTRRWSSSRRGSRPTRSTRRSTRASRRSSASPRACPRTRCCGSTRTSGRAGVTMIGPNCPGALSPGKANVGIIPAEIFREGNVGPRLALGDADVPDRPRADPARPRQLDHRRHRRRPGRRLVVHRRARALRGRRRDRDVVHGRRDRRRRGGEGGAVHPRSG